VATIISEEKVQIRFTVTDDDGTTFTDAIYVTSAERAIMDDLDIAAIQQKRFESWKAILAAPAPVVEIDQAAQARDLLEQRVAIEAQLDALPDAVVAIAAADMGVSPVLIGPIDAPILKV
jgi:hypothetical protein